MAYNMKDIFYLDVQLATGTGTGLGSAQLDLSAYIDPIARRGSKAQGLAIYKVQTTVTEGNSGPAGMDLDGSMRMGIVAGAGLGDVAVGSTIAAGPTTITANNDLLVYGADFYADTGVANPQTYELVSPDKDVPYIVVRDNACLVAQVDDAFASEVIIGMRLSCAVVTLDQSTLNQLLRTQTV
tara:strand:+ start:13 stop:561 length:549 start_codon:yes stop_codon:yes gene_type:complete